MVHPKYRITAVDFDIALLKLSQAVKLNTFVRTVCLPAKEEGDQATALANGIVAGWGVTRPLRFGELPAPHDISIVLRHASFTIQDNQFCVNRTMVSYNSALTFCAGDGKGEIDICQGDSGGAFLREDEICSGWLLALLAGEKDAHKRISMDTLQKCIHLLTGLPNP